MTPTLKRDLDLALRGLRSSVKGESEAVARKAAEWADMIEKYAEEAITTKPDPRHAQIWLNAAAASMASELIVAASASARATRKATVDVALAALKVVLL